MTIVKFDNKTYYYKSDYKSEVHMAFLYLLFVRELQTHSYIVRVNMMICSCFLDEYFKAAYAMRRMKCYLELSIGPPMILIW